MPSSYARPAFIVNQADLIGFVHSQSLIRRQIAVSACFVQRGLAIVNQALEICRAWQKAALLARNGKLSVDAAREVIAQGVADVFMHANVESLPSASIKSWCETWLHGQSNRSGRIDGHSLQANR